MNPQSFLREKLLFSWPQLRQISVLLPLMIVLAALLHLLALVLFGLQYPGPHPGAIKPASLTLLLAVENDTERIASWLESEDPALFSPTIPDCFGERARFLREFSPTFDNLSPVPLPLPSQPKAQLQHPLLETGPVPFTALPKSAITRATPSPQISRDTAGGSVTVKGAARRLSLPPDFQWPVPETSIPSPSTFLLSFLPDGSVASVFLSRSCGERSLDELAASTLKTSRMHGHQPSDSLQWATVQFFWDFPENQPSPGLPES
jgi:hypothetical protein